MAECINCGDFIFFSGGLCTTCYDKINGGELHEEHNTRNAKQETGEAKNSTSAADINEGQQPKAG